MSVISIENVTKRYKNNLTAVDGVSLEIQAGECFGLLGPNGAGKTTLIRMIIGSSPISSGRILIEGMDIGKFGRQARALIGVVPQIDNLDSDLPVISNMITFGRYFDIPAAQARSRGMELIRLMGLETKIKSRLDELSGGMKRRLLIARGLLNNPRVLILDEPTVGLDPQAKHMVWHKLRELKKQGVTLVLCTQIMEEAQSLADRVAIMHTGKVIGLGPPGELVNRYIGRYVWEIEPDGQGEAVQKELASRGLEFDVDNQRDLVTVYHVTDDKALGGLGLPEEALAKRQANLEDVFLRLTGRMLEE